MIIQENSKWVSSCAASGRDICCETTDSPTQSQASIESDWKLAKKLANESKKAKKNYSAEEEKDEVELSERKLEEDSSLGLLSDGNNLNINELQEIDHKNSACSNCTPDTLPGVIGVETNFTLDDLEKEQLSPKEGTLKKTDELAETTDQLSNQTECNCCDLKTVPLEKSKDVPVFHDGKCTMSHDIEHNSEEKNLNTSRSECSPEIVTPDKDQSLDLYAFKLKEMTPNEKGSIENLLEKCSLETKGSDDDEVLIDAVNNDSIKKKKLDLDQYAAQGKDSLVISPVSLEINNLAQEYGSIYSTKSSSEESLPESLFSKKDHIDANAKLYSRKHMHKVHQEINQKLKEQKEQLVDVVSRTLHPLNSGQGILEIDDPACELSQLVRQGQSSSASNDQRPAPETSQPSQGGARPKNKTDKRTY